MLRYFTVFALEDLKGIGKERWLDRRMRGKLRSWSYGQLERSIRYKAEVPGRSLSLLIPHAHHIGALYVVISMRRADMGVIFTVFVAASSQIPI